MSVWEEIFVHAYKYKKNGGVRAAYGFCRCADHTKRILDFNTLFFLAAAAFLIGVIVREFDLRYGLAFFLGCLILGGLLAPQKLYCITYAMMGIYVLGVEFLWHFLEIIQAGKKRRLLLILGKLIIFNLMYLPALFLFPKLLFAGEISGILLLVFVVGGQVALFLFDQAYDYFLIRLWEQVREKLFGRR